MNTLQRLLSNTFLAFLANVVVRASTSLLFILIGRNLGPTESGIFTLGTTYFTIVFGLSALGLQELLVRELAPRRDESARYVANYLVIRLATTMLAYLLLVVVLRLVLPYNAETERVILILSLAAIPEAIFSIGQSLFEAHEKLLVPSIAGLVNGGIRIVGGYWLLQRGAGVEQVAWIVPLSSVISVLVLAPSLFKLLRDRAPQSLPFRLNLNFARTQLRSTPGFFLLQLFLIFDYQVDTFVISLMLGETQLGWYSAAQTILLAIGLMPAAFRSALYPLMSRYNQSDPAKLAVLYEKASRYMLAIALPIAAGTAILAEPIISLIFGDQFAPAVPVLQISVWSVVFLFMNVPSARLLMVRNRQQSASLVTGASLLTNLVLNLWLVPIYGIIGAAVARLAASAMFFVSLQWLTRRLELSLSLGDMVLRSVGATAVMAAVVWFLRDYPLPVPVLAGTAVYGLMVLLLKVVPREDLAQWKLLTNR
jgi:O-antigen/teichoic acid export membrane protein